VKPGFGERISRRVVASEPIGEVCTTPHRRRSKVCPESKVVYREGPSMRFRTLLFALTTAAALTASAAFAPGAGASASTHSSASLAGLKAVAHSSTGVHGVTSRLSGLCGTAEGTWTQDGITAQNGAPTNPSLNTYGGKQVKCKGGAKVNTVVVDGYPNQGASVNKFNINVYKKTTAFNTQRYTSDPQPNDAKSAICTYTDAPATFAATGVTGAQWTIKLPSPCKIGRKVGKKGVFFAIQADYDQAGGQWFWATQTTADRPNEADWADTQNLFGLGCISFAKPPAGSDIGATKDMQDCIFGGDIGEKDFIMVLS
jgi:hypothetical protein